MKKLLLTTIFMLFALPLMAQVPVNLAWDASPTPSEPDNPINYKVYQCRDAEYTDCSTYEAGENLNYGPITLQHASRTWFFVTAWRYQTIVVDDGEPQPGTQPDESDRSNVLYVRAFAPPGNPSNQRITVAEVANNGEIGPAISVSVDKFKLALGFKFEK